MKTRKSVLIAGVLLAVVLSILPERSRAETTLEMAYMPIVPCSQLFVIQGMGWAKDAGINLELTRFSSGPAIVQAIASGNMDTMCFGIGPAMVTRGKGIDKQSLQTFIQGLDIPEAEKQRLMELSPATYIGNAIEQARGL